MTNPTPDFETMAYFTIDNIFPNLSDSQRESAATFIKLSLEAAFKAGREKGLDELECRESEMQVYIEALKKISDPRNRDHKEPDDYTEKCCLMHIANEALFAGRKIRKS
jgi:hypothetical protein